MAVKPETTATAETVVVAISSVHNERQLADNLTALGYKGDPTAYPAVYQFLFGSNPVQQAQRIRTEIGETSRAPAPPVPHWKYHFDAAVIRGDKVEYALDQTNHSLKK